MPITRQLTDHEIKVLAHQGYADGSQMTEEALAFKASVFTPLVLWESDMKKSDNELISREFEDHIKDDHGGVASNASLQAKYDAKVALRNSKPS